MKFDNTPNNIPHLKTQQYIHALDNLTHAGWALDNLSTWEALRRTVPLVIGLGLAALNATGPDVDGCDAKANGELFTRWIQMAVFMPLFRAHTVKAAPDPEPWSYGEPYRSIARRFIQLRHELFPYLYTATWQMTERGWPIVRPLWWNASDVRVPDTLALVDDQDAFLCGDALFVAPVSAAGATSRPITLPLGDWYNFWTNQCTSVPSVEAVDTFAPLEFIPLFARAGSVLTMGESVPSVAQRTQKFLRLGIYPLATSGQTVTELYEDTGASLDYTHAHYRHSRLVMTRDTHPAHTLTLTWESTGNYTPSYEHIELTFNGLTRAPRAVRADGQTYPILTTDPMRRTALLAVPPFEKLEVTL